MDIIKHTGAGYFAGHFTHFISCDSNNKSENMILKQSHLLHYSFWTTCVVGVGLVQKREKTGQRLMKSSELMDSSLCQASTVQELAKYFCIAPSIIHLIVVSWYNYLHYFAAK